MKLINQPYKLVLCCLSVCFTLTACTQNKLTNKNDSMMQTPNVSANSNTITKAKLVFKNNQTWQLVSAKNTKGDAIDFIEALLQQKKQITLSFVDTENTRLSFNAGCNTFNGKYQLTENHLKVMPPLMSTRMMCEGNLQATETFLALVMRQGANLSFIQNTDIQNTEAQINQLIQTTHDGNQLIWTLKK